MDSKAADVFGAASLGDQPNYSCRTNGQHSFLSGMALFKVNWGVGMMAMPYFLYKAGLVAGVSFFIASMCLTFLSLNRLLQVADEVSRVGGKESQNLTYTGVIGGVFGLKGEVLSVGCINLSSICSCIAYLIFIGDNLHKFVGGETWHWLLGVVVPITALTWVDDLSWLAPFNTVGLALAVGFAAVIVADACDSFTWQEFTHILQSSPKLNDNILDLAVATGLAVFCNEGIVVLSPTVRNGMRKPSQYPIVLLLTMLVFTCCYMVVALCGYALYGGVESDLALSLPAQSMRSKIAVVLYCGQLIPSFIIVYFMVVEATEDAFLRLIKKSPGGRELGSEVYAAYRPWFIAFRSGGVWVCTLVALLAPGFGDFLALSGSLANSITIYILPFACYLKLFSEFGDGVSASAHITANPHGPLLGDDLLTDPFLKPVPDHNPHPQNASEPTSGDSLDKDSSPSLARREIGRLQDHRRHLASWDVALSITIVCYGVVTSVVGTYASALGLFGVGEDD
jgi:vesicular inhibitory amino acid transporter